MVKVGITAGKVTLNTIFEGGPESAEFKQAIADKIADCKKNGQALTENEARAEQVADNVRKVIFAKGEDVRKLVEADYTFAQRILDIIESFLYNFKEKFGLLDGKEQFEAALLQAQRKYRMALADVKESSKNSIDTSLKYSIIDDEYVGKIAYLNGISITRKPGETIETAIRRDFKARFKDTLVNVFATGEIVKMDQIGKFVYGASAMHDIKQRSYPILDDMIRIATNKRWSEDLPGPDEKAKNHAGLDCSGGFNYFDTYFAMDTSDKNDTGVIIYSGTIICRIDKHGRRYFYDLDDIREAGYRDESDIKSRYPFTNSNDLSYDDILTRERQGSQEKNHEKTLFEIAYEEALKKKSSNLYSFSSPKTDTAPIGAEDFDVQPKNESNPELEKALADHDFVKDAYGNIRKYREERAEKSTFQKVKDEFGLTKPPSTDEAPTSNPDVAAVVNTEGLKRAEDIELQYSQRLKGKNGRHPCGYRPFLTQLLPKYCFLRRLIPN